MGVDVGAARDEVTVVSRQSTVDSRLLSKWEKKSKCGRNISCNGQRLIGAEQSDASASSNVPYYPW